MGRLSLNLTLHRPRRNRSHNNTPLRQKQSRPKSVNPMVNEEAENQPLSKKMKLDDLDLKKLIDKDDDDDQPPVELEVVSAINEDVDLEGCRDEFRVLSDAELEERIKRNRSNLDILDLPDNGAKLRLSIKRMEAEFERRKRDRDAYQRDNLPQSKTLNVTAGLNQDTPLSHGRSHSQFFSTFSAMLEKSDSKPTSSCNQTKSVSNGYLVSKREHTSRDMPFQCPTRLASNKTDYASVNSERKEGISGSLVSQRSLPSRLIQKAVTPQNLNAVRARRRQEEPVVLLDDDDDSEPDDDDSPLDNDMHLDDMQLHFGDFKYQDSKISYPSRDDPTHVDIDFFDVKCLAPEEYLSSPIMNFYIRYLQQPGSPIDKSRCVFHFFNTFFYSKLKGAVSSKGNDSACFAKFRRWWKGINIFHKAYILIPVHEDLHWSLIIICIPSKDRETGPLILHLDSLGLHNSRPIFENIKRFIREEWEYLTHEGASSNLPWEKLPRIIEEKSVTVPQQKNEYDCGLFVLYFMERFIAEAPDRLSRKDLQMFSREWFKPAEASELRTKIRGLLGKEFCAAQQLQNSDIRSNQT